MKIVEVRLFREAKFVDFQTIRGYKVDCLEEVWQTNWCFQLQRISLGWETVLCVVQKQLMRLQDRIC